MTRFPHYMAAMAPVSGTAAGHTISHREGMEYRVFTKPEEHPQPKLFGVAFSEAAVAKNTLVVNTENAPEAVTIPFALQHEFRCAISSGFLVVGVTVDIEGFKQIEDRLKDTLVSVTCGSEKIVKGAPLGAHIDGRKLPLDLAKEQMFGVKSDRKGGFPNDKFGLFLTNATDFSVDILKFPHQLKDIKITITVQAARYTSNGTEVRELTQSEINALGDEAVEIKNKENLQLPAECPKCQGTPAPDVTASFGSTGTPHIDTLRYACLKCKDWETTIWDAPAA